MLRRVLNALRPWPKHPIDAVYGIETSSKVLRLRLSTGDKAVDAANNGYVGSQPSIIRRALEVLPALSAECVFIDLGCGKGRVLAVATEFAFSSIVGIELSPPLCRTAEKNARRLASRHPERVPIQIVCGDATRPELPATGDVVLFLYNPFRGSLIAALIDYLETAIKAKTSGRVFVVYYNPASAAHFDQSRAFSRYYAERIDFAPDEPQTFANDFDSVVIWQASCGQMATPLAGADRWVEVRIPDLAAVVRYDPQPAAGNA